jgi:hypothetical protein
MFPLVNEEQGNPLVLFQIWINLPPKNKLVEPDFAMLQGKDTPVVECADVKGKDSTVKINSGEFNKHFLITVKTRLVAGLGRVMPRALRCQRAFCKTCRRHIRRARCLMDDAAAPLKSVILLALTL